MMYPTHRAFLYSPLTDSGAWSAWMRADQGELGLFIPSTPYPHKSRSKTMNRKTAPARGQTRVLAAHGKEVRHPPLTPRGELDETRLVVGAVYWLPGSTLWLWNGRELISVGPGGVGIH